MHKYWGIYIIVCLGSVSFPTYAKCEEINSVEANKVWEMFTQRQNDIKDWRSEFHRKYLFFNSDSEKSFGIHTSGNIFEKGYTKKKIIEFCQGEDNFNQTIIIDGNSCYVVKTKLGTVEKKENSSISDIFAWPKKGAMPQFIRIENDEVYVFKKKIDLGRTEKATNTGSIIVWIEKTNGNIQRYETYDDKDNLICRGQLSQLVKVKSFWMASCIRREIFENHKTVLIDEMNFTNMQINTNMQDNIFSINNI